MTALTAMRLDLNVKIRDKSSMRAVLRLLFCLVLTVAVLVSATSQSAYALTNEIAMAAMPCCDDDCPDDPSCELACMAMLRCAVGASVLAAPWMDTGVVAALISGPRYPDPPWAGDGQRPEGLKRPPRI